MPRVDPNPSPTFLNVTINADDKFFKIQNNSSDDKFTVDTDNGNTVIEGTVKINNETDASDVDDGGARTYRRFLG